MVRKTVFSRDDVIQAGFRLVDRKGREQLTARNVAEEMGSSTAPVYSNFSNMEELEEALVDEAVRVLLEATQSVKSGNAFLDIGLGVLEFTWQHPRWYEALFLGKSNAYSSDQKIMEKLLEAMAQMEDLSALPESERTIVLKKMAIFTHGMATEICICRGDAHSKDEWLILMDEVGETIVRDAFERGHRTASEIQLLGTLWDCPQQTPLEKEED